ncbi:hypothetical protein ACOMHN_059860 [Nucella lapillus]
MEGKNEKRLNIKGADDLIHQLGYPGRFQIMVFILVALNFFPVVFHHVCMAFYSYTPPFECRPRHAEASDVIPDVSASAMASYEVNGVNVTSRKRSHVIYRSCDVLVTSKSGDNRSEVCAAGEFRYLLPEGEKTVVMEWDLVCDQAYLTHLAATVYYCGVMLGGFACGYLSDYFGRRPVILAGLAGGTVLGTALGFVQNFPVFLVLRFIVGFLMQGLHMASYIMAVELFPVKERTLAGCVIQVFWGGAVLALGGVAWLLKDWRHIQLAISLPSVLALSYVWLVPESLRWLLAKEKSTRAEKLIKHIASFNKLDTPLRTQPQLATTALLQQRRELPDSNHNNCAKVQRSTEEGKEKRREKEKKAGQGSIRDLFSTTVMLKRSLILFSLW